MTDIVMPAEDPEDVPEPRDDDVEDRLREADTPFEEPAYTEGPKRPEPPPTG
jgi:hypothetical protein